MNVLIFQSITLAPVESLGNFVPGAGEDDQQNSPADEAQVQEYKCRNLESKDKAKKWTYNNLAFSKRLFIATYHLLSEENTHWRSHPWRDSTGTECEI